MDFSLDGIADSKPTGTEPVAYESAAWEVTFMNLPTYENGEQIEYSVTEDPVDNYTTTVNGFEITNTYNFGGLEISKTVDPGNGDPSVAQKEFEFKVEFFTDDTKEETTGDTEFEYTITKADGTKPTGKIASGGTVTLKHGEKVTFEELPAGIYYVVTETSVTGFVTTVNNVAGTTAEGTIAGSETATLAFTNTYNAEPVKAQIPVKKNITPENSGANDITGKFTFTLAAGTNTAGEGVTTPMPSSNTVVCGADGAEVKFGEIEYTAPGTYTYTVKESVTGSDTATSIDGITLGVTSPQTITVIVTDKGDGTLEAEVNGGAALEFNNPYTVTSIDITIPVEKILSVPTGLTAPDITGKFTFTIDTTNGAPLPETKTLTNPSATGGNMTFGDEATTGKITINAPGEYNYTITETGEVKGITNDAEGTKNVKVTVVNNGDGTLGYSLDSTKVSFTNTYNVEPTTAKIPVEKILDVGEGLNAPDITDEFTFTLTAAEGTPMPETTSYTNPEKDGGDMSFGDITYTKPGTYTYTVTETGEVDGVSAVGATSKTVTVTVVDNSDGTLKATVNGGEKVIFTNEYKVGEATAEIPVTKILSVPEGLTPGDITGKFTFTLAAGTNTAAGGIATPMPKTTSYTNPSKDGGQVKFGGTGDPITYTAPGTYNYTVTESGEADGVTNDATATRDVAVVVTDNGDGTMTAVVNNGAEIKFTNTYNVDPTTASFPVKKGLLNWTLFIS